MYSLLFWLKKSSSYEKVLVMGSMFVEALIDAVVESTCSDGPRCGPLSVACSTSVATKSSASESSFSTGGIWQLLLTVVPTGVGISCTSLYSDFNL